MGAWAEENPVYARSRAMLKILDIGMWLENL
jgi:hypothetical protein